MILSRQHPDSSRSPWLVALFGVGLVGSAIRRGLRRCARVLEEAHPLDWHRPAAQSRQLEALGRRVREIRAETSDMRLHVVWAAGQAGFGAEKTETVRELEEFRHIGHQMNRWFAQDRKPATFHLISSAGGLYEGQRLVRDPSRVSPQRPYARLKAAQESALEQWEHFPVQRIYRLSSVFGPVCRGQRKGLVPTLILHGLLGRVTLLSGLPTTLRDFVWADDIGRHVASAVTRLDPVEPRRILNVLASGRPTPLLAVIDAVEKLLGRKLYVRFVPEPANTSHITFSPALLPEGWFPRPWESGLRRVYDDLLAAGVVGPGPGDSK